MKSAVVPGLACAFALAVVPAGAQAPAGPELDVNAFTTGAQLHSAISVHLNGDFDVVWTSAAQDGDGAGVFGQRYDARGIRRGLEFQVNSFTTGTQAYPGVAALTGGGFVVAWTDAGQDGSGQGVFAQRYDAAGARRGAAFQVNTYTTGDQTAYGVSASQHWFAPDFQVVWTSTAQDGSGQGVFARRFAADGTPRGVEFQVNTHTTGDQYAPRLSTGADGRFVMVWVSAGQDGSGAGIFGQQFRPNGTRFGGEFRAGTIATGDQILPAVAMAPGFDPLGGTFTVAWSHSLGGGQYEVRARYFLATGQPGASEFVVAGPLPEPGWPAVAADPHGRFTVLWSSGPVAGEGDVFGRRTSVQAPVGPPFQVNTYTAGEQSGVAAATDAVGNLVASWTSFRDGSAESVQAQRFGGLTPAGTAVDTAASPTGDGNGVWEPCETVDLRPSWANSTGSEQSFAATSFALGGPLGIVEVVDGFAIYGPIPDGGQAACTDCYAIRHPCVAGRSQLHADVRAEETLSTVQGQTHIRWLHVGESFTDVPRGTPFYRLVETLLHNGVTAGCASFAYCPAAPVAREQMAVFVLRSKDPVFVPPACTTSVFGDVPASSPYCPWIEELARRGITAGCGGGNYCPAAAVSREETAVFVLRTLDPTLDPPACGTPMFGDVPASSPFCEWIEELARRGVVSGCGGGNYCPTQPVSREEMSAFLVVTFGLSLYGS